MRLLSWMAIFLSTTMLLSSYGPKSIAWLVLTAFGLIVTFVLLAFATITLLSERKQIKNEEKLSRLRIILFLILGLVILACLVFAGYKLGQKQVSSPQPTPTPNPTTNTKDAEGKFCGGIAANLPKNQCPTGYKCTLEGNYPDASGKCVKE